MPHEASRAEVRQALFDLQRYLSDQLAPMMVAESVEMLLDLPPQLVAQEIQGWVGAQFRGPSDGLTVSDCLYHAVKKIHMMAEFELLERASLEQYLEDLGSLILELCPPEDRELLRDNLGRLGQSEAGTATASQASVLHRQARPGREGQAPGGGGTIPGDVAQSMRRFSLLIERLARTTPAEGGEAPSGDGAARLETQLLTSAAVGSRSDGEFARNVEQLGRLGFDTSIEKIFRTLGRSLPGWNLATTGPGVEGADVPTSRPARAMRRIIDMAGDPDEGARRFNEMVLAAIEQFNEGRLVQAKTMFELAERIIAENKIHADVVKSIRGRAHGGLAEDRLRGYAEQTDKHEALRRVLAFFPALTAEGLLTALHDEERRDRRKLVLALLEVHGESARAAAVARLHACAAGDLADPEGYYRRNLVFLLRRIPRAEHADVDVERTLVADLAGWDSPPILMKEALGALGALRGPKAERILMDRLREIEDRLTSGGDDVDADVLRGMLDRTVSALIHARSKNAFRSVVAHALRNEGALGDTLGRLDELADHDLSGDPELVDRLLHFLERELPTRVLGFVVGKNRSKAVHFVRALSRTPLPAVRARLEDIRERFADSDLGEAAVRALDGLGASSRPSSASKGLSGDVELFGLPSLFQSLADAQLTGTLTLKDTEGDTYAVVALESGRLGECHRGSLSGESAFYQLFERPEPGSFAFESRAGEGRPAEQVATRELLPMILEALRRHDELGQAAAVVPDDLELAPTSKKPTTLEGEEDRDFMKSLWHRVANGATAARCEQAAAVDAYRVRRLLAHWVEEGALAPR